jgi:chloramphenicol-sensitive protein RarD
MRAGVLIGIAAYGVWGLFPLYFDLLDDVAPLDVLASRIAWTLAVVAAILVVTRQLSGVVRIARERRTLLLLATAAILIAANWGVYLYAVSSDQVLEAALGYFITPLVSVGAGMLVFGERLRAAQLTALGLGTVAVLVLTIASGGFPWIALFLAFSFGTYGLLKKLAGVGPAEGLTVETLVLVVPALVLILVRSGHGDGGYAGQDVGTMVLLAGTGPITALPLLLFAIAVARIPLSTIGLLQYLTPMLQFLIGWLLLGEAMSTERWVGFALVWVALSVLTWDGLRAMRDAGGRRSGPTPLELEVAEPT